MLTEPDVRVLTRPVSDGRDGTLAPLLEVPSPRRGTAWLRRHRLSLGIVGVLLLAVAVVHAIGMSRSPLPVEDEGTYVAQGWTLAHLHRLTQYTFIYDHPPAGWFFLSLWLWATGALARTGHAIAAGRELILFTQVASSALMYMLCRRLDMRRSFAVVAVLLFAMTPLALGYHRAVYLDNLLTPWLLASFVLALSPRRHLAAVIGSAVCFAMAVLIKETTLLLLPAIVYQIYQQTDRRTRRMALSFFATILIVSMTVYPLYAFLKGEFFPSSGHVSLLGGAWWQLFGRPKSGSIFAHGSIANLLVQEWLDKDSWLLIAGIVATPIAFAFRRLRPFAVAAALLGVTLLRPGYLPVPFIIAPLTFLPILLAGIGDRAWTASAKSHGLAQATGAVAIGAMACLLVQAAPAWAKGDLKHLRDDDAADYRLTEAWVLRNVPRGSFIVIDNRFWLDFVTAGFNPDRLIWNEKLDVDDDVNHRLNHTWRTVDYIISTPGMRSEAKQRSMPSVDELLANSRIIRSYGLGNNATQIRRVVP